MNGFSSSAGFLPEEDLDFIVIGSGSAGSTAAIAAAREGAKTLLLERYGFLGGTSTCVLDTFYGFYTPGSRSMKVVGGIADRVVEALDSFGACMQRPNTYGTGTGITYNSEYLKVVLERLLRQAGARILLHTWMQEVVVKDKRVRELVVATKGGLRKLRAKFFIDATGDADLCAFAGSPCELAGEKEPEQMLTTTCKMVNMDAKQRRGLSKDDFHQRMATAAASGRYKLPRWEGSDHVTPIPGMFAANMTRVESYRMDGEQYSSALTSDFLTSAEIEGRAQALEYIRFLGDEIPVSAASYYAPGGFRLNVVAPSLVRTPMSLRAQSNPEILDLMKRKQPLIGDMLDTTDVARLALFLLSDAAQAITGQVIRVDGGWSVSG
jgi:ribulose 1,5-bisphosphate synthetase/thiazole synthase